MSWISPRIWRSAESYFNDDEPFNSTNAYTPGVLQAILKQGFDTIWMRGRLWDLIRSEIYPELNDSKAAERIANLKKVIADGKELGIKVYLYFNEPLGFPKDHKFWKTYPELAGEPHVEFESGKTVLAFCTSTPQFEKFFDESVRNLFDDLQDLGGVILITASEFHSHCWSHKLLRELSKDLLDKGIEPLQCPNCRDREPADVVGELVNFWKTNADRQSNPPQVWAWNWSWSIWYDQPQREMIAKLPEGVKLMCDFERGGTRKQEIGDVFIDEYSLGYVGPSERFIGSMQAAKTKKIDVCGKLQVGITHELATVPNLPMIPNLFEKLKKADELGLEGLMCSWNFGNTPSLNTAALKIFTNHANLRDDKEKFLRTLATEYFDNVDADKIIAAWELFCKSFGQYPFSIIMLYHGPMNYSVAYPLNLKYEDRTMGPSWIWHEPFGDRLEDCLGPFNLKQTCDCFKLMNMLWTEGLELYKQSLNCVKTSNSQAELNCAEMIGCHISACQNIFDFHNWRRETMKMQNLDGPCKLKLNKPSAAIISRHIKTCEKALKLAKANPSFGYHQEPHVYFYDHSKIQLTLNALNNYLCKG